MCVTQASRGERARAKTSHVLLQHVDDPVKARDASEKSKCFDDERDGRDRRHHRQLLVFHQAEATDRDGDD